MESGEDIIIFGEINHNDALIERRGAIRELTRKGYYVFSEGAEETEYTSDLDDPKSVFATIILFSSLHTKFGQLSDNPEDQQMALIKKTGLVYYILNQSIAPNIEYLLKLRIFSIS